MENIKLSSNIKQILISEKEIAAEIKKTGEWINSQYSGKPLLFVSVLKGGFVFLADLIRTVSIPCEVGFMCAQSYYSGTSSSGIVNITMDLEQDVSGYHVIIKDVAELIRARNPLSLKIVTLLDKPSRRIAEIDADISLFTIPDLFVVGYGLDCGEIYRNLPYIAEYGAEKA